MYPVYTRRAVPALWRFGETPLLDLTTFDLHKNTVSNPYETPMSDAGAEQESAASLGELVRGWEKMRLLYNGILLLPGIGTLAIPVARGSLPIPAALLIAITLGLGANAAFFLGPLAELYFRGLFLRGKPAPILRRLLLIGGLLISFGAMAVFLIMSSLSFLWGSQ